MMWTEEAFIHFDTFAFDEELKGYFVDSNKDKTFFPAGLQFRQI